MLKIYSWRFVQVGSEPSVRWDGNEGDCGLSSRQAHLSAQIWRSCQDQKPNGTVAATEDRASHLSPLTSHLSPLTSHLSPLTSHLDLAGGKAETKGDTPRPILTQALQGKRRGTRPCESASGMIQPWRGQAADANVTLAERAHRLDSMAGRRAIERVQQCIENGTNIFCAILRCQQIEPVNQDVGDSDIGYSFSSDLGTASHPVGHPSWIHAAQ